MDSRVMKFRVGVMVLAAVLAAAVLVAMFGGLPFSFHKTYTIYVKFSSAPGLSAGVPVRKSGIRIGEVSNVTFAPDGQVLATLRIDDKYRLYDNETCCLQNNLLGDAWLEFEPAINGETAACPPRHGDAG